MRVEVVLMPPGQSRFSHGDRVRPEAVRIDKPVPVYGRDLEAHHGEATLRLEGGALVASIDLRWSVPRSPSYELVGVASVREGDVVKELRPMWVTG